MPYTLEYFRRLGIYEERTGSVECNFDGGVVRRNLNISERISNLLRTPGGDSHKGDFSRQDSAVITALLSSGLSPADTYATFSASLRGLNAKERKNGHYEDYITRTINKQVAFISENKPSNRVRIDFAGVTVSDEASDDLILTRADSIEIETTNWVWPGYIPAGHITVFAGDPGMGKSTIVVDLIARISRGALNPTRDRRMVTGQSVIFSAEDSAGSTLIPRLRAAGADMSKVYIQQINRKDKKTGETMYLTFPRDTELLKRAIVLNRARMAVLDPLNAFIDKGIDSNSDASIRRILYPIEAVANETGCAIIIVSHYNKKEDASAIYRVTGSIGIVGAARSVLLVSRTDEDVKVLWCLKANLGKIPTAMSYDIRQVTCNKPEQDGRWLGVETFKSSKISWIGEVDFDPYKTNNATPDGQSIKAAESFLREALADGPVKASELYASGRSTGISRVYLNKAKLKLGIDHHKNGDQWTWGLPESN